MMPTPLTLPYPAPGVRQGWGGRSGVSFTVTTKKFLDGGRVVLEPGGLCLCRIGVHIFSLSQSGKVAGEEESCPRKNGLKAGNQAEGKKAKAVPRPRLPSKKGHRRLFWLHGSSPCFFWRPFCILPGRAVVCHRCTTSRAPLRLQKLPAPGPRLRKSEQSRPALRANIHPPRPQQNGAPLILPLFRRRLAPRPPRYPLFTGMPGLNYLSS